MIVVARAEDLNQGGVRHLTLSKIRLDLLHWKTKDVAEEGDRLVEGLRASPHPYDSQHAHARRIAGRRNPQRLPRLVAADGAQCEQPPPTTTMGSSLGCPAS